MISLVILAALLASCFLALCGSGASPARLCLWDLGGSLQIVRRCPAATLVLLRLPPLLLLFPLLPPLGFGNGALGQCSKLLMDSSQLRRKGYKYEVNVNMRILVK